MATKYTIHFKCDGDSGACSKEDWVDVYTVQLDVPVEVGDHLPEGWTVDSEGVTHCLIHGGG